MAGNLGLLLFKEYYLDNNRKFMFDSIEKVRSKDKVDREKASQFFEAKDKEIFIRKKESTNDQSTNSYNQLLGNYAEDFIELSVTYPGLIVGLGYNIGIGVEGEFKNGFYFDWTTGVPTIPGSSVKGTLRSIFPLDKEELKASNLEESYSLSRVEYLNEISGKNLNVEQWIKVKNDIFEGALGNDTFKPVSKRDIFFGGEIKESSRKLIVEDYITPHGDGLKNPVPLKMMKIAPGTIFRVYFKLENSIIADFIFTKEEKLKLFKDIILDLGLGAKTNSGYGAFDRELCEKAFENIAVDRERNRLEKQRMMEQEKEEKERVEREKALKEHLESLSPQEREKIRISSINNQDEKTNEIMKIFEKLGEYSGEDLTLWATIVKDIFVELNKWNKNDCSKKQLEKVKKVKEILGE